MKKYLVLALVLLMVSPAFAESFGGYRTQHGKGLRAFDFEQITVSTAAVTLTSTKYDIQTVQPAVMRVTCYVDAQSVRVRLDGTAPTTSVGHVLDDGDTLILDHFGNFADTQFIRDDGTDATMECHYWR